MTESSPPHGTLIAQVGLPFLARRLSLFHDLLASQGQDLLEARGIDLAPAWLRRCI